MPVLYGTRVYPDGVHDFKYEGDGTMVINLAWSHACLLYTSRCV